jgi:carbamoyltransferase
MALFQGQTRISLSKKDKRIKKKRPVYIQMIIWGISANSHDAAIAVFDKKINSSDVRPLRLLYASQSERYSRVKNDADLTVGMIDEIVRKYGYPNEVVWYERPLVKTFRQFRAGQGIRLAENNVRNYLAQYGIHAPISYTDHHLSHAAGGFYTSGFTSACTVALDSIGEFDTFTIWLGREQTLKKTFSQRYPHSVGLWYSAFTQRLGLKPQEDEYILMGMAAYGDPDRFYHDIVRDFIDRWPDMNSPLVKFKHNLHRGCQWWRPELTSKKDLFDIAAAVQKIYEHIFEYIIQYTTQYDEPNLILSGGCALNCSANGIARKYYDSIWIMPNPGDSGSAIGAVLGKYQQPIVWPGPYLGHEIKGDYPVEEIIKELKATGICGVANGRAEFGPRSLGNRSLLADPRGIQIRDVVNNIKQRQQFRPFAPAILAEHAASYFDGPTGPYMQFTALCRNPELYPAIVHADGSSRVQTVPADGSGFRRLLEQWYAQTGCPMLLNTSLNIKGQPIVNTVKDAEDFEKRYGVKVFS